MRSITKGLILRSAWLLLSSSRPSFRYRRSCQASLGQTETIVLSRDEWPTLTEDKWGVSVRFKLVKNEGYDGEISVSGFGGAFE